MNLKPEKRLNLVLHKLANQKLPGLSHKLQQLYYLNECLIPFFDPLLQPHIQVADYKETTLYFQISSSVWATKFKYSIPQLLAQIKTIPELRHILQIHYFVANSSHTNINLKNEQHNPLQLSKVNANLIEETAKAVSDPDLKEALLKLAHRGNFL